MSLQSPALALSCVPAEVKSHVLQTEYNNSIRVGKRVFKAIHKEASSEEEYRAFGQTCSVEQKVQNGPDHRGSKDSRGSEEMRQA